MTATTEATRKTSIKRKILNELVEINDDINGSVKMVFREQLRAKRMDEEQKLKSSQGGKVNRKEKKNLKEKYNSEVKKIKVCCLVYVPNEGEDEYTLLGFELEHDDDSNAKSLMLGLDDTPHVKEPRNGVNG
ncbi:hypothetical protein VE03_08604 [Pseudogymnoascus sp. 23342-1-I1]|nr:hypothetical protein VE03_08604 [Pseudogymnoascus sp. 23342-1-I1]